MSYFSQGISNCWNSVSKLIWRGSSGFSCDGKSWTPDEPLLDGLASTKKSGDWDIEASPVENNQELGSRCCRLLSHKTPKMMRWEAQLICLSVGAFTLWNILSPLWQRNITSIYIGNEGDGMLACTGGLTLNDMAIMAAQASERCMPEFFTPEGNSSLKDVQLECICRHASSGDLPSFLSLVIDIGTEISSETLECFLTAYHNSTLLPSEQCALKKFLSNQFAGTSPQDLIKAKAAIGN